MFNPFSAFYDNIAERIYLESLQLEAEILMEGEDDLFVRLERENRIYAMHDSYHLEILSLDEDVDVVKLMRSKVGLYFIKNKN